MAHIVDGILAMALRPISFSIHTVRHGTHTQFPNKRDMAKTGWRENNQDSFELLLRPDFWSQPRHRILGVLIHEFGHMSLLHRRKFGHSELDADAEGKRLFGVDLGYDTMWVQSTSGRHRRKRPTHSSMMI